MASDARCLLFQPPGSGNRMPQALCVVSQLNDMMLYDQLLHAVENRLRTVDAESANDLLRTAYNSACPQPSHEINIRTAVCTRNISSLMVALGFFDILFH